MFSVYILSFDPTGKGHNLLCIDFFFNCESHFVEGLYLNNSVGRVTLEASTASSQASSYTNELIDAFIRRVL